MIRTVAGTVSFSGARTASGLYLPPAPALVRPDWDMRFLLLARWWSQWSTCPRLAVGAAMADAEYRPLVSGFNGSPRKRPHCTEVGCLLDSNGRCVRTVHGEMNCVAQAARTGVSLAGATLFVTHSPCDRCVPVLAQLGLSRIIYAEPYGSVASVARVVEELTASGIDCSHRPYGLAA